MSGHRTATFAAALLAGTSPVIAAEAAEPTDSSAAASMSSEADEQPTIVVTGQRPEYGAAATSTATRTNTPIRNVPQALTVISESQIEDQQLRSVSEMLYFVPGATPGTGESNRDQFTLRGNNTTADFFIDGLRDDVQYFRDFYNVERVEVLKGPNAMIFGRGGGGGGSTECSSARASANIARLSARRTASAECASPATSTSRSGQSGRARQRHVRGWRPSAGTSISSDTGSIRRSASSRAPQPASICPTSSCATAARPTAAFRRSAASRSRASTAPSSAIPTAASPAPSSTSAGWESSMSSATG